MTFLSLFFIVASLLSFVVAQLILKRAMVSTAQSGFRNLRFVSRVTLGITLMTISFFLTLGLLQRFDLSYLYPFQGLSVIIISLMAAVMLKEKLTLQLTIGALLISAGIVLVSLS
ncbi:MAG TPA: EamA family transporter [Candidatus Dormibacteraeota bacterium]|nr:EamA family transporter [Candidatus Dormibacteraeota bacterium]